MKSKNDNFIPDDKFIVDKGHPESTFKVAFPFEQKLSSPIH